ncbi:hypothetical protein V2G26_001230 [Clonostachys chloroleuca]
MESKPTYQPTASSHSPAIRNGAQSGLASGNMLAMAECITDIHLTSITAIPCLSNLLQAPISWPLGLS